MALDTTPLSASDDWRRDRTSFDDEVRRRNMVGYWMIPNRSIGFREPKAGYAPHLWTWESSTEPPPDRGRDRCAWCRVSAGRRYKRGSLS